MSRDTVNYGEALAAVNRFMEESGIRKYCREVCKGYCCGGCWNSEGACHRNEGINMRLPCSMYVCSPLQAAIWGTGLPAGGHSVDWQEAEDKKFRTAHWRVTDACYHACGNQADAYFTDSRRWSKGFKVSRYAVDMLTTVDTAFVKERMRHITRAVLSRLSKPRDRWPRYRRHNSSAVRGLYLLYDRLAARAQCARVQLGVE